MGEGLGVYFWFLPFTFYLSVCQAPIKGLKDFRYLEAPINRSPQNLNDGHGKAEPAMWRALNDGLSRDYL